MADWTFESYIYSEDNLLCKLGHADHRCPIRVDIYVCIYTSH